MLVGAIEAARLIDPVVVIGLEERVIPEPWDSDVTPPPPLPQTAPVPEIRPEVLTWRH
jgi:hypothetical protein